MSTTLTRRYEYRAYPNGDARRALARLFGCCRVVYNDFIAEREHLRHEGLSRDVSFDDTAKQVTTKAKTTDERAFLAEVSAVPLQQSVADARKAYSNFFDSLSGKRKGKKVGAPRMKRRSSRQAARFTKNARFKILDTGTSKWGKVSLPGVGVVRFARSRDLPSEPSSVTAILESDGTYTLSFVVKVQVTAIERKPASNPGRTAGIDAGFTHLATIAYSDGTREKIDNPRFLKAQTRKLRREQRTLSRREPSRGQRASKNYRKQQTKVAKIHAKVAAQRLNHHRTLAARLVRENESVCRETLSLSGMGRTRLAKSVYDSGIGTLFDQIDYLAENQGREVVRTDRWEPTTQTCSVCGTNGGKKKLSIREWTCTSCGTVLDRDYNAAVNVMVAAGLAPARQGLGDHKNDCGESVRRLLAAAFLETPTREEAGTLRTDLVERDWAA